MLFSCDTQAGFGTRGQVHVKTTFDGVPYFRSLVKYGHPQHMMPILKEIREKIGKGPGDTAAVAIERDETIRTVDVAAPFAALMKWNELLPVLRNSVTPIARSAAAGSAKQRRKRHGKPAP